MKNLYKDLKKGIVIGVGVMFSIGIIGGSYAVLSSIKASNGESLTVAKWDSLVDHSVPTGFVGSFALSYCPTTWSEYLPAQGRVIRGIDKTGTNIDPDGERVFGSIQEDDFESHNHTFSKASRAAGNSPDYFAGGGTQIILNSVNTSTVGNTETRSKNVALLYCIKN